MPLVAFQNRQGDFLRLLQAVDAKIQMGQKLMFEDEKTKEKSEMVLI